MTRRDYERLSEELLQGLCDDPPNDPQVVRHMKGLITALARWLKTQPAISTPQARTGTPRPMGHASADASLDIPVEAKHGSRTRQIG